MTITVAGKWLFVTMLAYVLDYQAEPDYSELPCCRMLYYHAAHRCHLGRCTGTDHCTL